MSISNIKKLDFPSFLANTDCSIVINKEGISEEGEPLKALSINKKCIFRERDKTIYNSEGQKVILNGEVLIEGDIAPDLNSVADGTVSLNGKRYKVYAGYRPRNPDGTVNHTKLELM